MLANVLLSIVSICTLISYGPQITQLIISKSSEDLSISSWVVGTISYLAYVLYAYLCTTDNMLKFTSMLELVLSCMVLILIVFFRIRDKRKNWIRKY